MNTAVLVGAGSKLDYCLHVWLDAKSKRSGSARTAETYRTVMERFRWALQRAGLDLDGDPALVADVAQLWCARPWDGKRAVGAATFNQRLAVLSSFYAFAIKRDVLQRNPMVMVERRPQQRYAGARAISTETVADALGAINRDHPIGLRDWCILAIALYTGRRLAELVGMTWGDIAWDHGKATVTFRAKGGKTMTDTLPSVISSALMRYVAAVHDKDLGAETRMWVSFSHAGFLKPLGRNGVRDIYKARLGTSKVHVSRHSFAAAMLDAGAKLTEIQARLGHESAATTAGYLAALGAADNTYGDALARMFGMGEP